MAKLSTMGALAVGAASTLRNVSPRKLRKASKDLRHGVRELGKAVTQLSKAGKRLGRKHPIETAIAVGLGAAVVGLEVARRRGVFAGLAAPV